MPKIQVVVRKRPLSSKEAATDRDIVERVSDQTIIVKELK